MKMKPIMMSLVPTLLLIAMPQMGFGQEASELKKLEVSVKEMDQTIQDMSRKIAEMEKQKGMAPASKAGLAEETTQITQNELMRDDQGSAPRSGNAPLDPTYKGFMQIPGTETWLKLGGYAKLDMIMDSTKVGNPNMFVTGLIPVEGEVDHGKNTHFAMHAKQTRFNAELRSPTPVGSLKTYYENDFFGNNKEPSMDYRLRHFYGQVANVTIGQTWSTFYDPDANPDTLDFEGPGSLPVLRQPEIRYTMPLVKDQMSVAIAAEQPKSDISNIPTGGDGKNVMPDFVGQWRLAGAKGHVQAAGVLRELSYDVNDGPNDNALGWGFNLSGDLKVLSVDSVMASLSYGDGLGRYVQDLPSGSAAVVDSSGNLETLTTYGGMVGYRHPWNEKWRSTLSYSYVKLDNTAELGDLAYDNTHYAQANVIWAPTKYTIIGLEYLYGLKETRDGSEGDDNRIQLSFKSNLFR